MLTAQCHIASSCLARYVLDYGKAMLGTVSALSLTSLGGSGGSDEKLKEEKQKTEAERKKNGTYISFIFCIFTLLCSYDAMVNRNLTHRHNFWYVSEMLQRKLESTQEELMKTQIRYQKEIEKLEKINRELKKQLLLRGKDIHNKKKIKVSVLTYASQARP